MDRWVRATRKDGQVIYINMGLVWLMVPQMVDGIQVTAIMATTTRRLEDGTDIPCQEYVRQTPDELLSDERRI